MKVGFGHEKGVTIHRRGKASVLDMRAGHCLEPEGNGVSLGEGGEGGPCPPGGERDKQSVVSEGKDNMNSANRVSGFFLQKMRDHVINVILIA
jgi:hypothetical protein